VIRNAAALLTERVLAFLVAGLGQKLSREPQGMKIGGVRAETGIQEIVDRETRAWNMKDVPLLLSVFHPDMVWAWPATYTSYDPVEWRLVLGKFDAARWGSPTSSCSGRRR
jgi:hypothetical protein